MERSEVSLQSLSQCLLQTLAPNPEPRKQAEAFLRQAADQPGYGIAVLQLVSNQTLDDQIRQAAAVNFKNHAKYRWQVADPDAISALTPIQDPEKDQIKGLILGLMLTSPLKIQNQLSEALAIISSHDFPQKWQSLLPELVSTLASSSDYQVIQGILQTVNSIFKKFRYQYKSNELYIDLKYCLDGFAAPLLDIFLKTGQIIAANPSSAEVLRPLFETQRLCCRIFYSLNFQELPEFFEDHMQQWMGDFHKYLTYSNPVLKEADPGKETLVDQLKAAICENINLYMEKNEEEFKDYLTGFATDVWSLLMDVSLLPSRDRLATTAVRFLTTVSKSVHHALFSSSETLKQICECIVIPNVRIRSEDEELFEMNHVEYIRRDMEGSDTDTRRRMACELVKGLSLHYKDQVTSMFSGYVKGMLDKFSSNPTENWKEKDCVIYLVVSLAPRQTSGGATGTDLVNVEQFFVSQIVPELQSQDVNDQPLLKADALKFVTTFRSQIPKAMALALLPNVIRFIVAESFVVHSYAAGCIEKLLLLKDDRQPRFAPADIAPFVQPLLVNLFNALKLPESQENAYIMKCIMRVLSSVEIGAMATQCLAQLTVILGQVCKNPTNPSFNHYLFEAVAAIVRKSCERDPEVVSALESILFPIIQVVLQDDITEFAPYVFQILAQLIETRRPPLPPVYMSILPPLLNATLWQRTANVPALVRLLQAYLQKAPEEIIQGNQLTQVLGVFQKLVYSRSTDHQGFFILNTVVESLNYQTLSPYIGHIWGVLFSRLQNQRTIKFIKSLIVFLSLSVVKYGHAVVVESINSVQPNLFLMILERVWISNLSSTTGDIECKLCSVAAIKLLTESPVLLADSAVPMWGNLLNSVLTLLVRPEDERVNEETEVPDLDEFVGYTTAYAQLYNAGKREEDPIKDIKDAKEYLVNSLSRLSAQRPGKFPSIIQQYLEAPNQTGLAQLCSTYRGTIV